MEKYLFMSSAAVVIGAVRVNSWRTDARNIPNETDVNFNDFQEREDAVK